jgi:hypothetical protein
LLGLGRNLTYLNAIVEVHRNGGETSPESCTVHEVYMFIAAQILSLEDLLVPMIKDVSEKLQSISI